MNKDDLERIVQNELVANGRMFAPVAQDACQRLIDIVTQTQLDIAMASRSSL